VIAAPAPDHLVWLDGRFVAWRDAQVHVTAHHYGVGVFEGVRAYPAADGGAALFRLADHTDRLFRSAHIMNIPIPPQWDRAALNQAQLEVVRRNGLSSAYLRPFVFYDGVAGLSLHTHELTVRVAVVALEWRDDGAYLRAAHGEGISVRTSSFTRHHPNGLLSKAKANGNYVNSILALAEARQAGADEAVLLDQQGRLTEASGANLFLVQRGALHTPPAVSVLEGITRDTIFSLAADLGIRVVERPLLRDELYVADEAFVTGTAAEVTPIRTADGRRIGAGARGPITARLQALYHEHVRGRATAHRDWLTWIPREEAA
jgi:branched-chain amino acid aminotransferase